MGQEAPVGVTDGGNAGGSPLSRFVSAVVPLLLLASLTAVPLVGPGPNIIRLLFVTLTLVTASVGWNLIGGFAGQISFGFAVFYGLGAYTTALSLNGGIPPVIAFSLGAVVAAVASLLIGFPTFRLKGPYFAIATIGVSEAVRVVMMNVPFTGGASGYRIIDKTRFVQSHHYYTALALAALAVGISILVRRSKLGLALIAIREDQDAASDLGVNPLIAKLVVHALAAALAAAAGGVYARYSLFIDPDGVFAFRNGIAILLMPIIGGVGTIWGPVIGAFVYGLIHEEVVANFPQAHLLIFGSLLILIILFEPGGVVGLFQKFMRSIRARSSVGAHS